MEAWRRPHNGLRLLFAFPTPENKKHLNAMGTAASISNSRLDGLKDWLNNGRTDWVNYKVTLLLNYHLKTKQTIEQRQYVP